MTQAATPPGPPSPLLTFYQGCGTDRRGRLLAGILAWDDERLELVHDYIQWLFPLPERSGFNPHAPILSDQDVAAFTADAALRGRLLDAFRRMLGFYGFALDEPADPSSGDPAANAPVVRPAGPASLDRIRAWLAPGDHNLLRVTRILRCLHLLGLQPYARAFLTALLHLHGTRAVHPVNPTTLRYWQDAAAATADGTAQDGRTP